MATDLAAKQQSIAPIIEGSVVDASERVAVCIKGTANQLPATLEALFPNWPFGTSYMVESKLDSDSDEEIGEEPAKITIYPRVGRGVMSIFTHIFLFESKGQTVHDKRLESRFIFSFDDSGTTERFIRYPGVAEHLLQLDATAKFSELVVKTDAGVYLSQPTSFNALEADVCRHTFRILGELAQILRENF